MPTHASSVPEACTRCPHLDAFHSACSHPFRQSIVREVGDGGECPLYPEIVAGEMTELADRLEEFVDVGDR